MPRPLLLVLLAALLIPSLSACNASDDQHYARALAIERELLRQNPEADYQDRGYLHVMRQLDKVSTWSPERERAERLMSKISDARRIALLEAYPQQVSHLPSRLEGKAAPKPPRTDFSKAAAEAPKATQPAAANTGATSALGAGRSTEPGKQGKGKLEITMYSTTWCGYCRKARNWFQDNGYPFAEKDIEKSAEAKREYQQASGGYGGVPLIVVNGQSFRGFDQGALLRKIRAVLNGT